jgi:uncharacterized protein (TIGR02452 family)
MQAQYKSILERYSGTPAGDQSIFPLSPPPTLPTSTSPVVFTNVSVVNADTLDVALAVPGSLLLNMGNPITPGGNPWIVGAQEEDLFRRTNLHRYLTHSIYPLYKKVVLSRDVEVVAAGLRQGYTPLSEPAYIDILTCSAIQNTNIGPVLSSADARTMIQKIFTIFDVAKREGYRRLVLSAFGCGGFRCPPEHISRIFQKALEIYAREFEEIVFAIWDEAYPKSNYAVFRKTLLGVE